LQEIQYQLKLNLGDNTQAINFLGFQNENLKIIEEYVSVKIAARGSEIFFTGSEKDVKKTVRLFTKLKEIFNVTQNFTPSEIRYAVELFYKDEEKNLTDFFNDVILVSHDGKQIKPRTLSQKKIYREP